jgi:hypothetical protein
VVGNWVVLVHPDANIKQIKEQAASLLTAIAAVGRDTLTSADSFREPVLCALLEALRIKRVHRSSNPAGSGKVWYVLDGDGGFVDSAGASVPGWVEEFLAADSRADVLRKLRATTAPRREVFIPVDLKGAPWGVASYLNDISRRGLVLPPGAPVLPAPVTGVWLASTMSFGESAGVRWDGAQWSSFRTRGGDIEEED